MTAQTRPDLSALLGSRICHDLISPLGAIGNGLELLEMSGTANGPEMALINDSVQSANARIRFFRIAFGAASREARIGQSELAAVLEDTFRTGRTALHAVLHDDLARADAKLALLLVLCLETALPMGGEISLNAGGQDWTLEAHGPRLKIETHLWGALAAPQPLGAFSAAEVQFALLPDAAARAGRALQVDLGEDAISVRF